MTIYNKNLLIYFYLGNLTTRELNYLENLFLNFFDLKFLLKKKWIILDNVQFLKKFIDTFSNLKIKIVPVFLSYNKNTIFIKSKFYKNFITNFLSEKENKIKLLASISTKTTNFINFTNNFKNIIYLIQSLTKKNNANN